MPNRAQVHESMTAQIARLVANYGITTNEAYDVLISTGYDMRRAEQLCQDAADCCVTVNQLLAAYTPSPSEVRE